MQTILEDARWSLRRRRSEELAERWPFAAEVLAFYAKLIAVQEDAFMEAQERAPLAGDVAAYAAERVVPRVIELSVTHGPARLTAEVLERFHETHFAAAIASWLCDEELSPVVRYVARAAAGPVLEALGPGSAAAVRRDERHCPACGGAPQLSYFATSPEDLVTAQRYLQCARCANAWKYPRLTCASCGETEAQRLAIFGEAGAGRGGNPGPAIGKARPPLDDAQFPHVRIDGCQTCSRYLLNIDLERDGRAVPLVDEIASIPLDLCAKERGMTKIVPNLLGF